MTTAATTSTSGSTISRIRCWREAEGAGDGGCQAASASSSAAAGQPTSNQLGVV